MIRYTMLVTINAQNTHLHRPAKKLALLQVKILRKSHNHHWHFTSRPEKLDTLRLFLGDPYFIIIYRATKLFFITAWFGKDVE